MWGGGCMSLYIYMYIDTHTHTQVFLLGGGWSCGSNDTYGSASCDITNLDDLAVLSVKFNAASVTQVATCWD